MWSSSSVVVVVAAAAVVVVVVRPPEVTIGGNWGVLVSKEGDFSHVTYQLTVHKMKKSNTWGYCSFKPDNGKYRYVAYLEEENV